MKRAEMDLAHCANIHHHRTRRCGMSVDLPSVKGNRLDHTRETAHIR
jgi:hypothetical protein